MTKSKQKQAIITRILTGNSDGLTSRELFNEMEPQEQDAFTGGVDGVGKELLYLKSKGAVENGLSKIIAGRTQLTWTAVVQVSFPEEPEEYPDTELSYIDDPSTLTLYAGNELDAPFIQIISALRSAQTAPDPVRIERKAEKIAALVKLRVMMSDDIHELFSSIVDDLQQLDEAAI